MKLFAQRLMALPLNASFAILIALSSGLGLMHFGGIAQDPLALFLPSWLELATQITYLVAGLAMFIGLGMGWGNVEAFGIIGTISGLILRSVVLVALVGATSIIVTMLLFAILLCLGFGMRLLTIFRGGQVWFVPKAAP